MKAVSTSFFVFFLCIKGRSKRRCFFSHFFFFPSCSHYADIIMLEESKRN